MIDDKKTIGLTPENRSVMDRIMEKEFFREQKDAALFAMAYAINQDVVAGNCEGANTIWNVGSLDPEGEVRSLVGNLFPDVVLPYRLTEHLINAGLALIGARMAADPGLDLTDFLEKEQASFTPQ
jgi:hypothetical protein